MLTAGLGSVGGDFAEGLGENGSVSAPAVAAPGPSSAMVSYGGSAYRTDDDAFRRRRRRKRDDLPYSKDPELAEARRELRKLAFYLHPDRTLELDDKTRHEYEELLRIATIEYHAQIERIKTKRKQSARFKTLRAQLRKVTARLATLELELVALRARTKQLEEQVATLRGVETSVQVAVKRSWAFPLFLGAILGVLATLFAGAWMTRKQPTARKSASRRKTRRQPPRQSRRQQTARRSKARPRARANA